MISPLHFGPFEYFRGRFTGRVDEKPKSLKTASRAGSVSRSQCSVLPHPISTSMLRLDESTALTLNFQTQTCELIIQVAALNM